MSQTVTVSSGRVGRALERLPQVGIDAMLVTDLVNVRYLTGYTGSNGLALIGPELRVFVTDFRYVEQAAEEVDASFERIHAPQELVDSIADTLPSGELSLGFEEAHVSVHQHNHLRELLPDRVRLAPVSDLVESLRAVKSGDEVAKIRAAALLADAAFEEVVGQGLVGRAEREVALALEVAMRERGAERPSFETIVASGPQGALPHATTREARIGPGQLVVIDWGAQLDGYCSDCTRTLATGELDERARGVYALTLSAQLAGLEGVRTGASGREVDAGARWVIEEGGYGEHFGHGLGHGVGLEIHEAPRLSKRSEAILQAGNVVTVEPGIYLPGELGVRIEDLVVVGERGYEILTSLPKELRIVE